MKAIEVPKGGGLNNLRLANRPQPTPRPGEVLVRWRATSLNYHDYMVVTGMIPTEDGRIPMSDGAGEIVMAGEGVTQWKENDKVMSLFFPNWRNGQATLEAKKALPGDTIDGCAVEYACVDANAITRIPDNYSFAEAATLPCAALTAWYALFEEDQIDPGDTVLIEGTGGVSMFALKFTKAAGATIYATSSSDEKIERLKELGADVVINYRSDENWGKTIYKLSGGIDHVLDIGGGSTIAHSIDAAGIGGNISAIGILGSPEGSIVFYKLFAKHARITGISVGNRRSQENMVRAINANGLKPVIDRSFTLPELADAFRYQEQGAHFGKIVVEV